ncbi:GNAT family N-acetyltransferase [Streptococcus hillyeri]|uniref:GNAT family N-acetyltransferase n=1 Tax=Streptococcus hillyeri TaxID=2282420 RepID=UPI0024829286|nr:GNAT family N-acetyltransferase [Streptococcus hillyeri]
MPESTKEYIDTAGNQICLLAKDSQDYIGFMSLIETSEGFEIDCMGVLKSYQNQGIGSLMMDTLKEFARQKEKTALLVKTLSEAYPSSEYAKTRAFYEKMGFIKSRYLDIWGEELPCLEMSCQF